MRVPREVVCTAYQMLILQAREPALDPQKLYKKLNARIPTVLGRQMDRVCRPLA